MPMEFEIFRAGNYPQGNWPPERVEQLVADYDSTLSEAPVTIDHAQTGPAFGWLESVRVREDGVVVGTFRDVHPWLFEKYQRGEYRKRSIEIKPKLDETGRPYIKAVTFLGARNPQIKGLADPQFEEIEGVEMYQYQDGDELVGSESDEGKDKKPRKGGGPLSLFKETMKKIFSGGIDQLDEGQLFEEFTAAKPTAGDPPPVAPPVQPAQSAADTAKFAEKDSKIAELEEKLAESSAATRKVDIKAFCDGLMREGKVTPAMKTLGLEAFMLSLSDETESAQKFAETAKETSTPLAFFQSFLETLPEQVEFKEVAPPGDAPEDTGEHEFMQVARKFAEDKDCSIAKAISETVKSKPALHQEFLEHQAESKG